MIFLFATITQERRLIGSSPFSWWRTWTQKKSAWSDPSWPGQSWYEIPASWWPLSANQCLQFPDRRIGGKGHGHRAWESGCAPGANLSLRGTLTLDLSEVCSKKACVGLWIWPWGLISLGSLIRNFLQLFQPQPLWMWRLESRPSEGYLWTVSRVLWSLLWKGPKYPKFLRGTGESKRWQPANGGALMKTARSYFCISIGTCLKVWVILLVPGEWMSHIDEKDTFFSST